MSPCASLEVSLEVVEVVEVDAVVLEELGGLLPVPALLLHPRLQEERVVGPPVDRLVAVLLTGPDRLQQDRILLRCLR